MASRRQRLRVGLLSVAIGLLLAGCDSSERVATAPVAAACVTPAPAFRLPDLAGRSHTLAEYVADQPVVLFFFTSWCPYCHKQIPALKAIDRDSKALGVKLIAIGAELEDTPDNIRRYAVENRLPYVVLYDEGAAVSARYDVKVVPAAFLVRQDGCMTRLGSRVSVAKWTQLRRARAASQATILASSRWEVSADRRQPTDLRGDR